MIQEYVTTFIGERNIEGDYIKLPAFIQSEIPQLRSQYTLDTHLCPGHTFSQYSPTLVSCSDTIYKESFVEILCAGCSTFNLL